MKAKEQILFELIDSIGECQEDNIHIIDSTETPYVFEEDQKYRIYHSDGYCFDVEYYRNYELENGETHKDYDENEVEYIFYDGWEGFKDIDIDLAIELIKKATQ